MLSKKYLGDYRVEEYIDERGRTKTRAVYKGDYYTIKPGLSAKDKKLIIAASAASWITYIGALLFANEAAHLTYVILPFTATALPLIFLIPAAVSLQDTKALMTREAATKTAERLPINSGLAAFFSGGAFLAYAVTTLVKLKPIPAGDILFLILALITALCAVLILAKTRKLKPCIAE